MAGFGLQALKRHTSLIPLVVIVGAGGLMAGAYLVRLALKNPDVSWDRKNNPEPWQHYDKKQYKFFTVNTDYSKLKSERPEF
uniref:Cytochrome c oxidase subunit NDUFA4 n=1 Tax=Hadrurus spadix TaxID=141984 RepID=A0A1W7RA42_9SCOR